MKDKYRYLWDGSSPSWGLLHINSKNRDEEPRYLIINIETRKSLLISDNDVYAQVQEAMLSHGVKVITVDNYQKTDS